MITEDLIVYIQAQLRKNIPNDIIISRLLSVGWHKDDVDEAFRKIAPPERLVVNDATTQNETSIKTSVIPTLESLLPKEQIKPSSSPAVSQNSTKLNTDIADRQGPDPYREQIGVDEPKAMEQNPWLPALSKTPKKAEPTTARPTTYIIPEFKEPETKSENTSYQTQSDGPIAKPVFSSSFKEANPLYVEKYSSLMPEIINQWTPLDTQPPVSIPTPDKPVESIKPNEVDNTNAEIEIQYQELMPHLTPKVTPPVQEIILPTIDIPSVPVVYEIPTNQVGPRPPEIQEEKMVFIEPKIPQSQNIPIKPNESEVIKSMSSLKDIKITSNNSQISQKTIDSLPKSAMLSSYRQVLSSAIRDGNRLPQNKRKKLIKWITIALVACAIIFGVIVVAGNSMGISILHFSLIKKDPKLLLLNTPKALDSLKSYKIETNATISAPSFADITNGLISGESITSKDKDNITFTAKGMVNNTSSTPIFDYTTTTTSSIMKNSISSELKYNNGSSYITIPNLSDLLGSNAPPPNTVAVPKNGFDSLVAILPANIQSYFTNINIDKVLSVGLPSYADNDITSLLKNFVSNASIIEKTSEKVHDIMSYHYEMDADQSTSKAFLSGLAKIFTKNLSTDEQSHLDTITGAMKINSFEVWIGENDNNIHQYKLDLTVPLSAVIGLNDQGIAGSEVDLSIMTSYYDFDIPNNIVLPTSTIPMSDFLKEINDMNIENNIVSFKSASRDMHNALGSYGKASNTSGSCINPASSSLFSPVGQSKGASVAVSSIASIISNLLNLTNNNLYCYSTPSTWVMSAPLVSDPTLSFCADSTDRTVITKLPPGGSSCK